MSWKIHKRRSREVSGGGRQDDADDQRDPPHNFDGHGLRFIAQVSHGSARGSSSKLRPYATLFFFFFLLRFGKFVRLGIIHRPNNTSRIAYCSLLPHSQDCHPPGGWTPNRLAFFLRLLVQLSNMVERKKKKGWCINLSPHSSLNPLEHSAPALGNKKGGSGYAFFFCYCPAAGQQYGSCNCIKSRNILYLLLFSSLLTFPARKFQKWNDVINCFGPTIYYVLTYVLVRLLQQFTFEYENRNIS